jgi:uncharacterized protein (TIGR00266 family)
MKHEIIGSGAFPLVRFYLDQGETIKSETGAMVAMTRDLRLYGKADGGIMKSVTRMFSGESFFMQSITAEKGPGWVLLAPAIPGEIAPIEIRDGQEMIVQKDGFFAGTSGIEVSTKVQSLAKGLFSGEGFFVVKLTGKGTAYVSTYGAIHTIDLPKGEDVLIDNGHLVAWDASMQYEITKGASSWTSSVTAGEGLACRFYGPGRILIQTRNPAALASWIFPFLPIPKQVPQA